MWAKHALSTQRAVAKLECSGVGLRPIVQRGESTARNRCIALDESFGLSHRREAMLGTFAIVVSEDDDVGQLGTRDVHNAARHRAHVPAFIGPTLLLALQCVALRVDLLGRRAKRREALASRLPRT